MYKMSVFVLIFTFILCGSSFAENNLIRGFEAARGYSGQNVQYQQQQQQQNVYVNQSDQSQLYNAINNNTQQVNNLNSYIEDLEKRLYEMQQRLTNLEMQVWDR